MSEVLDTENGSMVDLILTRAAFHLLAAKYFMLASFVILVYDHVLTFSGEVDRIWRREWTGATWLFALNRYLTELQFIVNLVSFHDPSWTNQRFIPFPGVSTLVSVAIAEIVLILRTYALYQRNKYVLALLATMWCGQVIIMATSILHSDRIPLPEGLVGCIMTGRGEYLAAFWLAPLAMDTVITALTIFKTLKYLQQQHGHIELVKIILRDGLLYFAVILVANLSNCLVYYLAPPDLKVIGASFSQIITIMMISRLQLNLRSDSICSPGVFTSQIDQTFTLPHDNRTSEPSGTSTFSSSLSRFFASTVAELGKDIGDSHDDRLEEKAAGARVVEVIPEYEIEMAPILPVRGGMPANDAFSPEDIECLEAVIQVSPRIVEG